MDADETTGTTNAATDGGANALATIARRATIVDDCEAQARALRLHMARTADSRTGIASFMNAYETVAACCDMARHQLDVALAKAACDATGAGPDNVVTNAVSALGTLALEMPTIARAVDMASDLGVMTGDGADGASGRTLDEARMLDLAFAMRDACACDDRSEATARRLGSNGSWRLVRDLAAQTTSERDRCGHTDVMPVPKDMDVRRGFLRSTARLSTSDATIVRHAFPDWLETVDVSDGIPTVYVRHPGDAFNRRAKAGEFEHLPESDYQRAVAAANTASVPFGSSNRLTATELALRLIVAGSSIPGSGSSLDRAIAVLRPSLSTLALL